MKRGIGGHTKPNRGATNSWLTPPEILAALGEFDLDPCPCLPQPWPTAKRVIAGDGLTADWGIRERVWMNPPYGSELGDWLERLADHGNGIALCFARTETQVFWSQVWRRADALLFLRGRLHFHLPDGTRAKGNAGGPSVLVAYGKGMARRLERCGIPGAFVPTWRAP